MTDIFNRFDPSLFLGIVPTGEFSLMNPWKGTVSTGLLLLAESTVTFIVALSEYLFVRPSLAYMQNRIRIEISVDLENMYTNIAHQLNKYQTNLQIEFQFRNLGPINSYNLGYGSLVLGRASDLLSGDLESVLIPSW